MVVVGRIARAHGNRGQVIVDPATDFPEQRFKPGSVLYVRTGSAPESLTIEHTRFHRGRPIIGLAGVETMNAAEALAGTELRIGSDALQPLPAGSYYHHDLIGCAVETPRGERIGPVTRVEGDGAASRMVIGGGDGEILIPLVEGICVTVDIAARRIVVEPPEGLLDANVTRKQRF
ncbi:MAG TPA: ribosome maturation factor RimM [Vicinamibacterales bacterium]|nr:ribosome maturation factor RimM [Vicinamibacterales bacterium]